MVTLIRKTSPADVNLRTLGGVHVNPIRHSDGQLAGYTSVEVPDRTAEGLLRSPLGGPGWRVAEPEHEPSSSTPTIEPPADAPAPIPDWARAAVSLTIPSLALWLDGFESDDAERDRAILNAAEIQVHPPTGRVGALAAIAAWGVF